MTTFKSTFNSLLLLSALVFPARAADYAEIPYYLRQLEQTDVESKRMEYLKIIHDAVVNADLSDKKVVKKLQPIIARIQVAIDSGLDRPYLEGTSSWLDSAVAYFEREKFRQVISVPASDWLAAQSQTAAGAQISTFPEKILLNAPDGTKTIAESSNIHEAVITPDGKKAAFFRTSDDGSRSEVWVINLKNLKRKKVASLPEMNTLLFSQDGNALFLQEKPKSTLEESNVYRISSGGGTLKKIGTARSLETLVAQGKYKDDLIVLRVTKHHLGTTQQDCAYVWSADGEEVGRIDGGPCQ